MRKSTVWAWRHSDLPNASRHGDEPAESSTLAMSGRDFSAEATVNVGFRAWRAARGRLRGRLFKACGFFAPGTEGRLFFGSGPRFINPKLMRFGAGVAFGTNARLECFQKAGDEGNPKLIVGRGTTFGDGTHIGCINRIEIGDSVLFGSYVLVVDHSHGTPRRDVAAVQITPPHDRPIVSKAPIKIGKNVWVGDGVVILPGADIGEGAIIGAHATVRGHVPARTIYLGETL